VPIQFSVHKRFLIPIIQLASCVGAIVSVISYRKLSQQDKLALSITCVLFRYYWHPLIVRFHVFRVWFSTNFATDITVVLALLWQLSRTKSPFKSTQRCVSPTLSTGLDLILDPHMSLSSLLHRLMVSTICSGTVTAVTMVISGVLYRIDNRSNGEPHSILRYLRITDLS